MNIIKFFRRIKNTVWYNNHTWDEIDTIIIKGTEFDRKRKLTDKDIKTIKKLLNKGKSYREIANEYNVDIRTVRYNTDNEYRLRRISQSNGKHYGRVMPKSNRIMYKTNLLLYGDKVL